MFPLPLPQELVDHIWELSFPRVRMRCVRCGAPCLVVDKDRCLLATRAYTVLCLGGDDDGERRGEDGGNVENKKRSRDKCVCLDCTFPDFVPVR